MGYDATLLSHGVYDMTGEERAQTRKSVLERQELRKNLVINLGQYTPGYQALCLQIFRDAKSKDAELYMALRSDLPNWIKDSI